MLEGKVVLVTGAASGMGAATARLFIAHGARVVLTDVSVEAGSRLAGELGENARFERLDVADRDGWAHAAAATEEAFGPLNVLVNNAGIDSVGHIEKLDKREWDRGLAVMLYGPLLGMEAAVPSMRRAGGGSIINISSLQGLEAEPGLTPYIAAKSGLRGLTKAAAIELGRYGIRANAVFPGLVMTGLTVGVKDHFMGAVPLRRPSAQDRAGTANDVANLAAFLASDDSSYITGAEIPIDGAKSVRFSSHFNNYNTEIDQIRAELEGASNE